MIGKGRWRLAGVLALLLVQAALAAFLGFVAAIHWDESNRFQRKSGGAYVDVDAATRRAMLEGTAAAVDVAAASTASLILLLTVGLAKRPPSVRSLHRFGGWAFLALSIVMFLVAFGVPRVGSAHDDMFHSLGFFVSGSALALLSGAAFLVARLLRPTAP